MLDRHMGIAALAGVILGAASALLFVVAPVAGLGAGAQAVQIENFTFAPERIVVAPGTTVTWLNEDDIPHTVAATDRSFKSKVLDTDDSFSFTFARPGTFEYFCSLHPYMKATIVVAAGAENR